MQANAALNGPQRNSNNLWLIACSQILYCSFVFAREACWLILPKIASNDEDAAVKPRCYHLFVTWELGNSK